MKNNPKIDFCRSDAVHTVPARYEFSENEKKIIQAATIAAKKEHSSMSLINRAEVLLKDVANSREPNKDEMVGIKVLSSAIGQTSTPSRRKSFSL